MLPKFIALALACISAVAAAPAEHKTNDGSGHVELYREPAKLSHGTIIYYGAAHNVVKRGVEKTPDTKKKADHKKKAAPKKKADSKKKPSEKKNNSCPTLGTPPVCNGKNDAANAACDNLIGELNSDASVYVQNNPRQICYLDNDGGEKSNNLCCLSWHNTIKNLTKSQLVAPAQGMAAQCTQLGVSGLISRISINGVCTKMCLSNRRGSC